MPSPAVSVIIPAYNYARCLPDAVRSALVQREDGADVEIIVVDDGSTDDTPAVTASFGGAIRAIRRENGGLSAARNTGVEAATGEFLVFLDADDLLAPGVIARHLETFRERPDLGASVCQCAQTALDGGDATAVAWPLPAADLDAHLCCANIAPPVAFMIRASAARAAGPFDTALPACEDYDFWLRCAAAGCRFGVTPRGLAIYRRHGGSMSARRERQIELDALTRLRAGAMLDDLPGFPAGGRRLGMLAYAAGTLARIADLPERLHGALLPRLLREFSRSVRAAAAAPPPPSDRSGHRDAALLLHASRILEMEGDPPPSVPASEAADLERSFLIARKLVPEAAGDARRVASRLLSRRRVLYASPELIRDDCARMGHVLRETGGGGGGSAAH